MKKGTRVRMSENLKRKLRGDCIKGHKGPWDDGDCWGCSTAHVDEFGNCEGLVEGPVQPNCPEVDVRWAPSNLRYGYHPDDLIEV